MSKVKDLRGAVFGRLTALYPVGRATDGGVLWMCECRCDDLRHRNSVIKKAINLTAGRVRSCGCLTTRRKRRLQQSRKTPEKHGLSRHRLYQTWIAMIGRCHEPEHVSYKRYGGRGIKVCERWHNIRNFVDDMDASYDKGLTLDRVDNEGDYTPENCRWATKEQQAANTYRTKYVVLNEFEKYTYKEFCEMIGFDVKIFTNRYDRLGWSLERTLKTPIRRAKRKPADVFNLDNLSDKMGKPVKTKKASK
jgi:hypothetical protein